MSNQRPNANSRDQEPREPFSKDGVDTDNQNSGKGHPPLKGTDTPATTDLEYIDREKGKRTTM